MPATYVPIASQVLSANAASVTFSNISNAYTDLVVRHSTRGDIGNSGTMYLQFNGDTSMIYSDTSLGGENTSVYSGKSTSTNPTYVNPFSGGNTTANTFGSGEIYIPNYAGSTNKPLMSIGISENNSSTVWFMYTSAGLRSSSAAINSVTLFARGSADYFVSGSSFHLYGIKAQ